MEKSIYTDEYAAFLRLLRETRGAANLTQVQLAKRLRTSQSFVSKAEVGERRLDLIQLRTILHALGTTLPEFVSDLEAAMRNRQRR
jgi:transcriptional regulator with XRE-family HTH domain